MAINGTARSRAKDIISMRSVESLERNGLVVTRAADILAMRAALAECVKLIQRKISPKESARTLRVAETAVSDDAGKRLYDLIMREGATIEDVRVMLQGEVTKEAVAV